MGGADQRGGPRRTVCGQWLEEWGLRRPGVGRCWVLAPAADLPSSTVLGAACHRVPKLPAGALLLKGDPSP